jgi:hypothetical protein
VRLRAFLVAAAAALAAPAPAQAIDHVSLHVLPTPLAGKPGWQVSATVPGHEFHGGEILGVNLSRQLPAGGGEEVHALRANLRVPSISFDGRRGRWSARGQPGRVLSVNMTIAAGGAARARRDYLGCRGAFAEVPVTLRGAFVLRTGTQFFETVRIARLRGVVTFNRGGAVDCTPVVTGECRPYRQFWASRGTNQVGVSISAATWLTIGFREPLKRAGVAWYHWLSLTGFAPLSGALPTFDLRLPASLPIVGGGTFSAQESGEATVNGCRRTTTRGTFVGSFQARFTGWGRRTLDLNDAGASYVVGE